MHEVDDPKSGLVGGVPSDGIAVAGGNEGRNPPSIVEGVDTAAPSQGVDLQNAAGLEVPEVPAGIVESLAANAARSDTPHLRLEAALVYMTDPDRNSIRKVHQDPRFAHLHIRTLESWSKQDGWVEKRDVFLRTWADQAYKRLGSSFVERRREDLGLLQRLKEVATDRLLEADDENAAPIKSFEGGVGSVIALSKRMEELEQTILGEMMPPDSKPESPLMSGGAAGLSAEELERLTATLLDQRREAVRLAHGINADAQDLEARDLQKEAEESPSLGVEDGKVTKNPSNDSTE